MIFHSSHINEFNLTAVVGFPSPLIMTILRVGIIGAGEVAQVIHLPVLSMLSHLFTTTIICDISQKVNQ